MSSKVVSAGALAPLLEQLESDACLRLQFAAGPLTNLSYIVSLNCLILTLLLAELTKKDGY